MMRNKLSDDEMSKVVGGEGGNSGKLLICTCGKPVKMTRLLNSGYIFFECTVCPRKYDLVNGELVPRNF